MYAATTTVSVAKSRLEIEALLRKSHCTQYVIGTDDETRRALVQFKSHNRLVRFIVSLPNPTDERYTHRNRWTRRTSAQTASLVDQATRQRWRALFLVIKAKLESVESQISTFEEEFLSFIVMPGGQTVGEMVLPAVATAYESGTMSKHLLLGSGA